MNRYLMLFVITLLLADSGFAQGSTATLQCAFDGELELHASSDPLSPVIGSVECGDRILVFDQYFAWTHLRTADGRDGYITNLTIGQWAIVWDAAAQGAVPVAAVPSTDPDFRRFEVGLLASYIRLDGADLGGGELSFTVNLNDRFALVTAVDVHEDNDLPDVRFTTYRFGVRGTLFRTSLFSGFAEATAGGSHVRFPVVDDVNGFAFDAGGGLDLNIRPWIAWRIVKVDYALIRSSGETSDGVRAGTGVVFRFGRD